MAQVLASGNYGQVRITTPNFPPDYPIATLKSWQFTKQTTPVPVPNFGSPVDGDGNVWPFVLNGLSTGTVSGEGQFNVDPSGAETTDTGAPSMRNGLFVYLDLIFVRPRTLPTQPPGPFPMPANLGFQNVFVLLTNVVYKTTIDNQAASFTFESTISGIGPQTSNFA